MNTKIKIIIIALLLMGASLMAQSPIRHNALKSNDYGVVYSLPITQLDFELKITKTTYKRGEYYQYAKQYLSIDNPIVDDKVVYKLVSVDVENVGIPDNSNSYLIQFKSNSVEPFVYLTNDGLICSINDEAPAIERPATLLTKAEPSVSVNAKSLLTEEILLVARVQSKRN